MAERHPPLPPGGSMRVNPLESEAALSTRGQHLPGIIQSHSSASLTDMRKSRSRPNLAHYAHHSKRPSTALNRSVSTDGHDLESGRASTRHDDGGGGGGAGGDRAVEFEMPDPPFDFPLSRNVTNVERTERKGSNMMAQSLLNTPQMRSQRLIGNSNPRYKWEQYYKTDEQLKKFAKPIRKYYERNNYLVRNYSYIDRLLDSSLPYSLLEEYSNPHLSVPETISEESASGPVTPGTQTPEGESYLNGMQRSNTGGSGNGSTSNAPKLKRTPKNLYKVPTADEQTPLMSRNDEESDGELPNDLKAGDLAKLAEYDPANEDSSAQIVTLAIYINFAANLVLLIMKIIVTVLTSSISVLASLVDAALDFLSTVIVWTTTFLISRGSKDTENYPVGRRRLEPIGVLVFSVIMITSFFQVALEAIQRLSGDDHVPVQLSLPAIGIMLGTVVVKGGCWLWCRLIKNSSVQALAQDASTDVVFNTFSIIFPLAGYYAGIWWLDPLGGLLLSLYVIFAWSATTRTHILNLTGHSASADERNILLYLTMRFAHTIRYIQGCTAYHAGDRLNVEVDIVLDSEMSLRDSHDLGESLQYVLESVPGVERAFVHADYRDWNLPNHMLEVDKSGE